MKHTDFCHQSEVRRKAWEKWFPNFCRKCSGFGFNSYSYDPSPPGISLGTGYMIETDPCGECIENGTCPRCGSAQKVQEYRRIVPHPTAGSITEDGLRCSRCGWDDVATTDTPMHECSCWEDEVDALLLPDWLIGGH